MITTILMWTGIGFAHLMIGTVIGKWNWRVWKNGKENFSSFMLFPVATLMDDVGKDQLVPCITSCDTEEGYAKLMAFMWSSKLTYHLIIIPFAVVACALICTGSFLAKIAGRVAGIAAQPINTLEKLKEKQWQKKLAKAKQLKLSPVDPFLDGYTRSDIETQMEEQRRILEKSTTEYERLKKIHENTWSRG